MTAVEFCDRTPIENVISSLTTVPDKIIFVGDSKVMKKYDGPFRDFLSGRQLSTQVVYRPIRRHDLQDIVAVLTDIVEQEKDCVFDLTGGEDLVLVAMGIVFERYKDRVHLQLQRFNVRNGVVTDVDNDGRVIYTGRPSLQVWEQIGLHGGRVRSVCGDEYQTCGWDFGYAFRRDVEQMWQICKKDPSAWNAQVGVLGAAASLSEWGGLTVCVDPAALEDRIKKSIGRPLAEPRIMEELCLAGLIYDFCYDEDTYAFTFKNKQIKSCLTKAGMVLELKVLVTAMGLQKEGEPYYTDAVSSVYIDWDGLLHARSGEIKDTENEIDVVLMKGLIPVFISCKNGTLGEDELYKLDSVTTRFGGQYAKRVLISGNHGKSGQSLQYFRQRCKDMKIQLIENVYEMSEKEFTRMIASLVNN